MAYERWSSCAALMLAMTSCQAATYVGYRMCPDYPKPKTGELALPGLKEPVIIYFDAHGIYHLQATNDVDLVRAMGFVHGRERFFQMDVLRRYARGRLAALVGDQPFGASTTTQTDRVMQAWGFGEVAERDAAAAIASGSAAQLQAYVEGVNHALSIYEPLEHRLLDVAPEPWAMVDTFALGRLNAWSVSNNWAEELGRLLLALRSGAERSATVFPAVPWAGPTSLGFEEDERELPPSIVPEIEQWLSDWARQPAAANSPQQEASNGYESIFAGASNGWAIGGSHTKSGKPILAGDPHMPLLVPSLFFPIHLGTPDLNSIGFSIPGLPFVLMGHNEDVAWTSTAAYTDVMDLYIEVQNPENALQVMGPDGWYPLATRQLRVGVLEDNAVVERTFTLRSSMHGPLVNDIYPDLLPPGAPLVSLRWATGEVGKFIAGLSVANRVKSVDDLMALRSQMTSPSGVITMADRHGKLGQFWAGVVPIRPNHRGTFPVPGWLGKYLWQGQVESLELPAVTAGADGILVHANNLARPPTRSRMVTQIDTAPSYRLERIRERIAESETHDLASVASIQVDLLSLRAKRVAPRIIEDLRSMQPLSPVEEAARDMLSQWNHVASANSAGALVFFATYRQAAILALRDELDANGLAFFLSSSWLNGLLDQWLTNANHAVWDDLSTATVEDRTTIVRRAFKNAVKMICETQGDAPAAWQWGRVHVQRMPHPFGSKESLADLVNVGNDRAGGGPSTIWKSSFDMGNSKEPFRVTSGPVGRHVVDLGNPKLASWVISTGVSGWPGSPRYSDQYDAWSKGEMIPMLFDWAEVRAGAAAILTLIP